MYGANSSLNHWRLADELSVIDATFLTLSVDPGHFQLENPSNPSDSRIFQIANFAEDPFDRIRSDDEMQVIDASQFRAVFKAIRSAILSNKLRAKISNWARHPQSTYYGDLEIPETERPDEETRNYGFALSRGIPTLYSNSDSILNYQSRSPEDRVLFILKEPDWSLTMIELDELKRWYASRGFSAPFFFPDGISVGFKDKDHPRYSAKLATAIEAWEAVTRPAKNKSVKASLLDWIISNGVRFGLGNDEGIVSKTAAEEVAKIANWQTGGGATRTYDEADPAYSEETKPIQNFEEVEPEGVSYSTKSETKNREVEDDPPF